MVGEKWREKRMGPSNRYGYRGSCSSSDGFDSIYHPKVRNKSGGLIKLINEYL